MSKKFILKNILDDTYYVGSNNFTKNIKNVRIFDEKGSAKTALIMDDLFYNTSGISRLEVINLRKIKIDKLKNI